MRRKMASARSVSSLSMRAAFTPDIQASSRMLVPGMPIRSIRPSAMLAHYIERAIVGEGWGGKRSVAANKRFRALSSELVALEHFNRFDAGCHRVFERHLTMDEFENLLRQGGRTDNLDADLGIAGFGPAG